MAQSANLVDQGVDAVQDAIKNADKEFQRLQRRAKTQRRTIGRRIETRRKSIEKGVEKQVKSVEKQVKSFEKQAQKQIKQIRKNDYVKRAETLRKDVQSQIESGLEQFLGVFQVATKSDVQKIDRKLNRISKKLKELEASPQV